MKANKPVIFLTLLIIISLSLAGSGFYLLQKEHIKSASLAAELENLKVQQRIAESKLQESKRTISDLESKLSGAKDEADRLNVALEEERTGKEEAAKAVTRLTQELQAQENLKSDLEAALQQTQAELEKIKADLKQLHSEKEALESRMRELGVPFPGVELGKIVVSPEADKEVEAMPEEKPAQVIVTETEVVSGESEGGEREGKVLVVNKDYNFAVINLGSRDGLNVGDIFGVFHDGKYVGDVKVEKLHDSMAAAGFLAADAKDLVKEGDKVIQKGQ